MPPKKPSTKGQLFLPELVEERAGRWQVHETDIRESAVDLQNRRAWVPKALTLAQRLARLHELGHVKYTPREWGALVGDILRIAASNGEEVDPTTALRISKMLEENRIDWLLWDRHGIDLRPAREALDWEHMAVPSDPLAALHWVLQLAWTVWASRGLSASVPHPPPARTTDEATGRFFDQCWSVLANHHPNLSAAIVRGCLRMYAAPSHASRNMVAAELATFFPVKLPHEEPPPEKEEEKQAQRQEEQRQEQEESSRTEEQKGGVGNDVEVHGHYAIHDHTLGIRRPSMKIARRETPQYTGTKLTFPHRYMLDKAVFARRTLTEAGIMIDGSGSMQWTQDDMADLLERMPAVWIGYYAGYGSRFHRDPSGIIGRICILAKRGRFSVYQKEPGFNPGNDIDLEALQLLATWPKPRFWLSDGYVCGGVHSGPHPDPALNTSHYLYKEGALVEKVNRFMRAHEILRVRTKEDMHRLVRRQRVTLYRSAVNWTSVEDDPYQDRSDFYPDEMREQPVTYQL